MSCDVVSAANNTTENGLVHRLGKSLFSDCCLASDWLCLVPDVYSCFLQASKLLVIAFYTVEALIQRPCY